MSVAPNKKPILEFFSRHLIGIVISYRLKDDNPDDPLRVYSYSGTLICFENIFAVLTAGHCIEQIKKILASTDVEIVETVLADIFGDQRISDKPIPFSLRDSMLFSIDDDALGLDFGLIRLHINQVRLLGKNGIVAVFEENWGNQHKIDFDHFFVLGFPEELTESHLTYEGNAIVSPSLLPLNIPERPVESSPTKYERFVGEIRGELPIDSIVGMSGGPIIGLSRAKPDRYWVVAIQSSWNSKKHLAYGCSLPVIGAYMRKLSQPYNTYNQ